MQKRCDRLRFVVVTPRRGLAGRRGGHVAVGVLRAAASRPRRGIQSHSGDGAARLRSSFQTPVRRISTPREEGAPSRRATFALFLN